MRLLERIKDLENNYIFLRWATGCEYGKIINVGEDFVEFQIVDVETMEFKETAIINHQLILELMYGGADVARIIAEISSKIHE